MKKKNLGAGKKNVLLTRLQCTARSQQHRIRHLETILESMSEAIMEVHAGRVAYANSAAAELLGIPLDRLLSARPRELFDQTAADRIDFLLRQPNGATYTVGMAHPLEINQYQIIVRRYPMKGEADTTILVLTDVTKQRELEYQLSQVRRLDAIGNLAGGIAHNFNNLLMGIQGNVSILAQDKEKGDPGYEELIGIERCVDSSAAMTRQLLSFAKGGVSSQDLDNVNDIVERSAEMFARARKEIQVCLNIDAVFETAKVDASQFELALMDLYVNAWHAMPNGGTLTISTADVELDALFVKPFRVNPGRYLRIDVADTGEGMDAATIERIFEPFFTTKAVGQGTGLGLASVFGTIEKHRGIITVESTVGAGSVFSIYLPVSRAEQKADSPRGISEKAHMPQPIRSGTILVVDDEAYILDANKSMLGELGYEVLLAEGGEDAIRLFTENKDRIDLLLLDMIMPDLSGEVVYERVKSLRPDVRVILSSGYSVDGQVQAVLKKGCNGFLQKPYNMEQLAQMIGEALR
jgi:two-component system cell cycle sensor histidine kinase/response regulator CckA